MGLLQFKKTESLDAFAKLLATENLTIITNPNARTASFRLASRTLVLPSWEEFQNEHVRELFRAHECAHALFTPPVGWHDAIAEKYADEPLFAGVLNILEDARIENALKRRYPGFKMVFPRGYWHLYVNGFFGTKPVNKLNFADRINIHTKLRQHSSAQFSPEEQKLVDKIDGVTSWPEVVNLAHEVLKLLKEDLRRRKEERAKQKAEEEAKKNCKNGDPAQGQKGQQKAKRSKKDEEKQLGDEDYDENHKLDFKENEEEESEGEPGEPGEQDPTKMPTGEPSDPDPDAEGEQEAGNPTDEADEDENGNTSNNESGEPEKGEGDGEAKEGDQKGDSESGKGEEDQKAGKGSKKKSNEKAESDKNDQLNNGQDDGVNENRDPTKAQDGSKPSGDAENEEDLRTETDEQYRNQLKKLADSKRLDKINLTIVSIFETRPETIKDHMISMEKLQKHVQRSAPVDFAGFLGQMGSLDD